MNFEQEAGRAPEKKIRQPIGNLSVEERVLRCLGSKKTFPVLLEDDGPEAARLCLDVPSSARPQKDTSATGDDKGLTSVISFW